MEKKDLQEWQKIKQKREYKPFKQPPRRKPNRIVEVIDYKKMTKEELADLLNERNIEFDLSMSKGELISLAEGGNNG